MFIVFSARLSLDFLSSHTFIMFSQKSYMQFVCPSKYARLVKSASENMTAEQVANLFSSRSMWFITICFTIDGVKFDIKFNQTQLESKYDIPNVSQNQKRKFLLKAALHCFVTGGFKPNKLQRHIVDNNFYIDHESEIVETFSTKVSLRSSDNDVSTLRREMNDLRGSFEAFKTSTSAHSKKLEVRVGRVEEDFNAFVPAVTKAIESLHQLQLTVGPESGSSKEIVHRKASASSHSASGTSGPGVTLCKFGKNCIKDGCTRDHNCRYFNNGSCDKTAQECKFIHKRPESKRNRSPSQKRGRSKTPAKGANSCAHTEVLKLNTGMKICKECHEVV